MTALPKQPPTPADDATTEAGHSAPAGSWEERIAAAWYRARTEEVPDDELRDTVGTLVAELPAGHPVALYETGSAWDSTGVPDQAIAFYRAALDAGLPPDRRRQTVIQLASSLRNVGRPDEAVAVLRDERRERSDDLDAQLDAFLALALADAGHAREGVGVAVAALGGVVQRYHRSLVAYGEEMERSARADAAGRA
ncbi:tetratricopeptide repeat protein [Luteimicrobium sp. DT211]|uniref:tetratricopeptide repeat protein n=1 Tax=Luteimicrobium sp. DT211 TaxID=3393412 RepID=UPI003CF0EFFD